MICKAQFYLKFDNKGRTFMRNIYQNYDWYFKPNYDDVDLNLGNIDGFDIVNIPHTNQEVPLSNFSSTISNKISTYKKFIDIDDLSKIYKLVHAANHLAQTGNLTGNIVLMVNTLCSGFLDNRNGSFQGLSSSSLVTGLNSSFNFLDSSLNCGTDRFISLSVSSAYQYSFLCGFDICHDKIPPNGYINSLIVIDCLRSQQPTRICCKHTLLF